MEFMLSGMKAEMNAEMKPEQSRDVGMFMSDPCNGLYNFFILLP